MRWLAITSIVMALGGCGAQGPVKPFEGSEQVATISEEESRLWIQARDVDQMIRRSGQIYLDEVLQQYVQQVMDQLYPEFKGTIRVKVIDSPTLNAFALPNGSIYFNGNLVKHTFFFRIIQGIKYFFAHINSIQWWHGNIDMSISHQWTKMFQEQCTK